MKNIFRRKAARTVITNMDKPKVNLTVNGKTLQVDAGTSVFNAAMEAGIFVPHYCYHVDLSVAGVCRMCMVEIEKNPRLQISCNTVATEGMVVRTDTQKVKDTVKNVLELHLINHPLDCPICDKAGECKLQDFYAQYGLYASRMEFDAKVHKPKVVDIGTIVLDSERCILCSRCVRFTSEVTKTNELGIFNRGDRSVLRTYDGKPLRNEYTGNLADICPVGALTAKDFRFQQRVWFLEKTESVCTLCARGCNTVVSINPKTQELYRVEPRRNVDVNKSWICDEGRWGYHHVESETRVTVPLHKVDGKLTEESWHIAFKDLHEEVKSEAGKVLVGLATFLTNEEIADLVKTFQALGVKDFTWVVEEAHVAKKAPYDGILKHRDQTPNARGFEKTMQHLGVAWMKHADAEKKLKAGAYSRVLFLGLEGTVMPGLAKLLMGMPKEVKVLVHATSMIGPFEKCDWVLPNVSSYEKSGTVVNALGRLQKLKAAMPAKYISRDGLRLALGFAKGSDKESLHGTRVDTVFQEVTRKMIPNGAEMVFRKFNKKGLALEGGTHAS